MNFKETQKFTQWWLWIIIIASNFTIMILLGQAYIQQVFWEEPWGDQPLSDSGLTLLTLSMITISIVVTWGFAKSMLETEIKNGGVFYRFPPFIWNWRKIDKSQINSYEVTTFNRVFEYGGYGYRPTLRNGLGLIIKGNNGLKIIYGSSKKKLLIGTQKPQEIKEAMEALMNKSKFPIDG